MANLNQEQLRRLARLGAMARLEQLRQEEAAIRGEFPELFGRGRQAEASDGPVAGRRRRRRAMSAAARRAVSLRRASSNCIPPLTLETFSACAYSSAGRRLLPASDHSRSGLVGPSVDVSRNGTTTAAHSFSERKLRATWSTSLGHLDSRIGGITLLSLSAHGLPPSD